MVKMEYGISGRGYRAAVQFRIRKGATNLTYIDAYDAARSNIIISKK